MSSKVVPGTLVATPSIAEAAREAATRMADVIRDAVRDRGLCALALSGGSSPVDAYRLLAKERVEWRKVHVFWVDERAVGPSDPRSNFGAAKEAFLDLAGIPPENVHRMTGEAADLAKTARDYEAELRRVIAGGGTASEEEPRFDLIVLGVGDDGHTASLFPNEPTVHVDDRLVVDVPASAKHEARLTLTKRAIENARSTVLIVLGEKKRAALERLWAPEGSLDETPSRIVRSARGAITWVTDHAAIGFG